MNTDRRQFARINFNTQGFLVYPEAEYAVEIMDLSLKGALVRYNAATSPLPDERCVLRIPLGENGDTIYMEMVIAHQYSDSDSVGLRCIEIDLDSITHLRRLVELNLGDENLLNRELEALIQP